jgi:hypothetical protein
MAHLLRRFFVGVVAGARAAARELAVLVRELPDEVQGNPQLKQIDARLEVLAARAAILQAEYQLLLAQAKWDYLAGSSPIDEAVAPFAAGEREALERKSWIQWLTILTK